MSLLKKIASAFRRTPPKQQSQRPSHPQSVPNDVADIIQEVGYDVDFLITRLNHPGKNLQDRAEKRKDAMQRLQELGPEAEKAIPALIEKLFAEKAPERKLAAETLKAIDPNWPANNEALSQLPFLIKKLGKGHLTANRAMTVLSKIGPAAEPYLEEVLQPDGASDELQKAKALRAWNRVDNKSEGVVAAIRHILQKADAKLLLEAAVETLAELDRPETVDQSLLYPLLDHDDAVLRHKTVKAMANYPAIEEEGLPLLFKLLAAEQEELRRDAVALLQKQDAEVATAFYREIVFQHGELQREDIEATFEKLGFIFSKSTVEEFRLRKAKFIDNLSWYGYELQQEMERPKRLLQSVLEILNAKSPPDPELAKALMTCFEEHEGLGIRKACVELLAKSTQEKEEVIPLLVQQFDRASGDLRPLIIEALTELDPDWVHQPVTVDLISKLTQQLNTSGTVEAAEEKLLSIGDRVAPVLLAELEQSDKRVVRQKLIELLGQLGPAAVIDVEQLRRIKAGCTNRRTQEALQKLIERLE
ncbi:MAG: hypothetical protein GVY26_20750 [Bacteroidetes bacterium]|jgi:HEAT repeat protein|nr:hypothetical protein [Bacteroidota bacterium]